MKKHLFLSLLMLASAFSTTWAWDLSGLRHITDLSQIKEGGYYYIVSDRTKFNVEVTTPKAIAAWQSGFPAWDNASQNKYFVYWSEIQPNNNAFVWKAEKVGDQWAFQNTSNSKYLGVMHKHHPTYPHSSETDMVFSDDAKGFTLTDLNEGEGRWAFTNSECTSPFTPQRYAERSTYNIALRDGDSDSNATDAETYGYPGRWHLYEIALEEGVEYFIINDRVPAGFANNTGCLKAMSSLQGSDIHPREWGEKYIYWGDFVPTNDGYKWTIERNGEKWAIKNTKTGKYIDNHYEPVFVDDPVYFTLTDLTPGANRFYIQPDNDTRGINVQGYAMHDNSCVNLVSEEGNEEIGYSTRWHFVKVDALDDFINKLVNKNAGTNEITEIAGASGTNIIGTGGVCQSLVLTDGESYAPKKAFTATSAIYERTMANEWGTICLPYEVSSNDEVEYYTISGIENDVLQVTKLATLPAGTPALMRKVSGTGITATASNVSVLTAPGAGTSTAVEMYGTFQQGVEVTDANAYYIKNNKFWQCNNKFYCDAFRAYFKISGSGSPSFSINISDDDVTGITSATDDKEATMVAIYAPDGTRRTTLQQGVNIVKLSNGKTVKTVKR